MQGSLEASSSGDGNAMPDFGSREDGDAGTADDMRRHREKNRAAQKRFRLRQKVHAILCLPDSFLLLLKDPSYKFFRTTFWNHTQISTIVEPSYTSFKRLLWELNTEPLGSE